MNKNNTIGQKIRFLRKLRGFSQTRLAKIIGCVFQSVNKYETGEQIVPITKLYLISKGLGVDIEYFLNLEENNENNSNYFLLKSLFLYTNIKFDTTNLEEKSIS